MIVRGDGVLAGFFIFCSGVHDDDDDDPCSPLQLPPPPPFTSHTHTTGASYNNAAAASGPPAAPSQTAAATAAAEALTDEFRARVRALGEKLGVPGGEGALATLQVGRTFFGMNQSCRWSCARCGVGTYTCVRIYIHR